MSSTNRRSIVAAGHPATASAARRVLDEGGTAFDAAIAACFAACVVEPMLASLGGGGFLLARTASGRQSLYDFFAHTPREKNLGEIELYAIEGDFGGASQIFHIGKGAIATPGLVKGLFRVHRDLGTIPIARLIAPAAALARGGVVVDGVRAHIQEVLTPILDATPEARRLFASGAAAQGELWRTPELAGVLDALAEEGEDLFYRGELARALVAACADGGHLTAEDLRGYRVIRRDPLRWRYRGHRLTGNPAPSSGGALIAFALKLLEGSRSPESFGSTEHLGPLLHAMALTNSARADAEHRDLESRTMLHAPFLEPYRHALREHLSSSRGTTHVSIADGEGRVASLSVSNGEGCGFVLPGTGIMLNNMLGEEDLHPGGIDSWTRDRRLSSMMAPTVVERADGRLLALGSGGSNRLRTAILQVLINLLDLELSLAEAVSRPRMHFEGERLDFEPGLPASTVETLAACGQGHREHQVWEYPSFFFGGVHAVELDPRHRTASGAGDPRRGGAVA